MLQHGEVTNIAAQIVSVVVVAEVRLAAIGKRNWLTVPDVLNESVNFFLLPCSCVWIVRRVCNVESCWVVVD